MTFQHPHINKVKHADRGVQQSLDSLKESVEVLLGRRADPIDRALTVRDLVDAGVISYKRINSVVNGQLQTGTQIVPGNGGSDVEVVTPTTPQDVQATGAFTTVLLEWRPADYSGHKHTEVWRADIDSLSSAVKIGEASAPFYVDAVEYNAKHYYWVRHVNINDDHGPWHSAIGLYAETKENVSEVIAELNDSLNESHLSQNLRQRIDLIDTPGTGLVHQIHDLANAAMRNSVDIDQIFNYVNGLEYLTASMRANLDGLKNEFATNQALDDAIASITQNNVEVEQRLADRIDTNDAALVDAQTSLATALNDLSFIQQKVIENETQITDFRDAFVLIDPDTGEVDIQALMLEVNDNTARLNTAETKLSAAEASIASKASATEVTALTTQVTTVEQNLDALDGELTQVASRVTATENSLTSQQTQINQNTTDINLRATISQLEDVTHPLYDPINGTYAVDDYVVYGGKVYRCITAVTSPETFNTAKWENMGQLSQRLSQAEIDIDAANAQIALRVLQTDFDAAEQRITDAESSIVANTNGINLKASQAELEGYAGLTAPFYSNSNTYAVGDTVIYNVQLWECTTAVTSPEAFDSNKWQSVASLANKFSEVEIELDSINAQIALTATQQELDDLTQQFNQANLLINANSVNTSVLSTTFNAEAMLQNLLNGEDIYTDLNASDASIALAQKETLAIANDLESLTNDHTLLLSRFDNAEASFNADITTLTNDLEAVAEKADLLQTQMYQSLAMILNESQTRSDAISAEATARQALSAKIDDNQAAIVAEQTARADGDAAEAAARQALATRVDDAEAAITAEQTARADGDTALTNQINTVQASVDANAAAISTEQQARIDGDAAEASARAVVAAKADANEAAIVAEQTARADADSALSTRVDGVAAAIYEDPNAATPVVKWLGLISTEETARVNADNALSSRVTTVETALLEPDGTTPKYHAAITDAFNTNIDPANTSFASAVKQVSLTTPGGTATLENKMTAVENDIDGIHAEYTVKLDVNGYVAGFGLSNSGTTSDFIVHADRFAVAKPAVGTDPIDYPFVVTDGKVYLKEALIDNATIMTLIGQKIVAEQIAANVSLTSPVINAGQVTGSIYKAASNGKELMMGAGVGKDSDLLMWYGNDTVADSLRDVSNAEFFISKSYGVMKSVEMHYAESSVLNQNTVTLNISHNTYGKNALFEVDVDFALKEIRDSPAINSYKVRYTFKVLRNAVEIHSETVEYEAEIKEFSIPMEPTTYSASVARLHRFFYQDTSNTIFEALTYDVQIIREVIDNGSTDPNKYPTKQDINLKVSEYR